MAAPKHIQKPSSIARSRHGSHSLARFFKLYPVYFAAHENTCLVDAAECEPRRNNDS